MVKPIWLMSMGKITTSILLILNRYTKEKTIKEIKIEYPFQIGYLYLYESILNKYKDNKNVALLLFEIFRQLIDEVFLKYLTISLAIS